MFESLQELHAMRSRLGGYGFRAGVVLGGVPHTVEVEGYGHRWTIRADTLAEAVQMAEAVVTRWIDSHPSPV